MLEQQVDLINIDPGVALQPTVADDAVEDAVQHHQHPHRQELLAQIPDIIAEDTGIGVHIGGLGKGVETAVCKQLNGQRHILCFLFRLAEQLGVEVLQGGDRAVIAAADIVPVHLRGAAVDDGFFLGRQLACPDELFTEGEQKFGFQHHGVLSIPIALLHIHGVDMVGRCGGDVDDLAAQSFDEGAVLRLRIDDDDIVLRGQRQRHHLLLGAEGFTGAGDAQNECVAVEKLPAVRHDEIFADGVLPVVHTAPVPDLLRLKGHENSQRFRGQCAQGIDAAQAQRQRRHQPVRLLPVQGRELAEVLAGNGLERFRITVQLFLTVCQMHQRHHGKHHPLVAGGEIVQHLAGLLALLLQIVGDNGRKVIVGVLPALPVGHIGFHTQQAVLHLPHRLVRRDRDDVDGQHETAVQAGELIDHGILDVAGIFLQKQHPAIFAAHDKMVLFEFHAVRADGVLEGAPVLHVLPEVKAELAFLTHTVKIMQDVETFCRVQLLAVGVHVIETGDSVIDCAVEEGAGFLNVLFMDGQGDVPLLHDAVG